MYDLGALATAKSGERKLLMSARASQFMRLLTLLLLTALPLWAGNRETIVPQGYTPGLTLPQAAVAQPVATLVTVMLTPGQSNLVAAVRGCGDTNSITDYSTSNLLALKRQYCGLPTPALTTFSFYCLPSFTPSIVSGGVLYSGTNGPMSNRFGGKPYVWGGSNTQTRYWIYAASNLAGPWQKLTNYPATGAYFTGEVATVGMARWLKTGVGP
jgi:hypothetical protein